MKRKLVSTDEGPDVKHSRSEHNVGYELVLDEDDLKLKIPSGMVIGGATSSGKTELLLRLLENYQQMYAPVPKSILYCYGQMGSHVHKLQKMGMHCVEGVPSDTLIERMEKPMLLIFDDMMTDVSLKYLSDIFCKRSHHQNIGVIFITQDLFDRKLAVARNNAQYLLLTRSINSMNKIHNIGSHLYPGKLQPFLESYNDATSEPYGYLFLDNHAARRHELALRTKIFPQDVVKYLYYV